MALITVHYRPAMTSFLHFRSWARRGPVGERTLTGTAAVLLLALVVWASVPTGGDGGGPEEALAAGDGQALAPEQSGTAGAAGEAGQSGGAAPAEEAGSVAGGTAAAPGAATSGGGGAGSSGTGSSGTAAAGAPGAA
ncbi:MAG: hypothetical protein JWM64_662, partial [Frankiales bacterium]|nr:hypothetical protein [Frankiales bacterium]